MVSLHYNDFYFFLSPTLLLCFLWLFFLKINSNTIKSVKTSISQISVLKTNPNNTFVGYYIYLLFLNFFFLFTLHGCVLFVLHNHFNLSNYTVYMLYIFIIIGLLCFFLLNCLTTKTSLVKSVDYLFSINNVTIILPYLFFVNTTFTFLFLLELVSTVILYNLISSKIWFKESVKSTNINNNIPQNYINMVFFQYWVTFLGTIFIIYFYINMFCLFGSSDWFLLQYFNKIEHVHKIKNNLIRFLVILFVVSVFLKLGITPFHLFKVEVYKGIPYLSIFFYTTYYFIVFFLFFLSFLSDFLLFFTPQFYFYLNSSMLIGTVYILTLLFDISFIKVFFTYSTIINSVGFLTAFLANI